jgi:hypothetical protein
MALSCTHEAHECKCLLFLSTNRSRVSGVRNNVYIKEPHYLLLFEIRRIPRSDIFKCSLSLIVIRVMRPGNRAGGWRESTVFVFRMTCKCKFYENHGCSFLQKLRTPNHTVSNGIFGAMKPYERSEKQWVIHTASRRLANYLECLSGSPTLGQVPAHVRIALRTEFSFFTQLVHIAYA